MNHCTWRLVPGPLALAIMLVPNAPAAVIDVPSPGIMTIQTAINTASDGDEIVVADGTWSGPGNVALDFHGKAITLRSASGDPNDCTLFGENTSPLFIFNDMETNASIVDGFKLLSGANTITGGGAIRIVGTSSPTIRNCIIFNCTTTHEGAAIFIGNGTPSPVIANSNIGSCIADGPGGGIYCSGGSPTLDDVQFLSCRGSNGGGVYVTGASVVATDCKFITNETTTGSGGGVYALNGTVSFAACTFRENTPELFGGGLYMVNCAADIDSTLFEDNVSRSGGGFYHSGGAVAVTACQFNGNDAAINASNALGGAITISSSDATITDCSFTGNTSTTTGGGVGQGGAIEQLDGTATLLRCTFSANVADASFTSSSNGGALRNLNGEALVVNCVFRENEADFGGAISTTGTPGVTAVNCLMLGNVATVDGAAVTNWSGAPSVINCLLHGNEVLLGSMGGCLAGDGVVARNSILWGNIPGPVGMGYSVDIEHCVVEGGWPGAGNLSADPGFVNASNDNFRVQAPSPCIDNGANAALPADTMDLDADLDTAEPLPLDLDEHDRVLDGDGDTSYIVDIGPYELPQPCPTDLDGDGGVGFGDILRIIAAWGPCTGGLTPGGASGPPCVITACGGVAEGEPCDDGFPVVDTVNGGCNSTPFVAQAISVNGPSICGVNWAFNGSRDTDWYEFSLTETTEITTHLRAETDSVTMILEMGNGPGVCPTTGVIDGTAYSHACDTISQAHTTTLLPGDYALFVARGATNGAFIGDGFPCPGAGPTTNAYEVALTAPCAEDLSGNGVVDFADILFVIATWGPCP